MKEDFDDHLSNDVNPEEVKEKITSNIKDEENISEDQDQPPIKRENYLQYLKDLDDNDLNEEESLNDVILPRKINFKDDEEEDYNLSSQNNNYPQNDDPIIADLDSPSNPP